MKHIWIILLAISSSITAQEAIEPEIDSTCVDEMMMDTIIYDDANDIKVYETTVDGRVMTAMILPDGDTVITETLDDISITSLRKFQSPEDYRKYMKFKRYAAIVYPYAKEAIKIFRETEHATQTMNRRKRKKHNKQLQEELKEKFEKPLTKLTKLQGKILIKMIERELDEDMYSLIANLRGKLKAFYWHNASKLYDYDLKEGYQEGKYEILDAVLQDFDISYRIEQDDLRNSAVNNQKR